MNALTGISFESSYRQLDQAARAFVDDFVTRVEGVAERQNRELFDVLQSWPAEMLSDRDLAMLERGLVKSAVFERIRDMHEAQNVSPRKILKEIAAIAFNSVDHFWEPGTAVGVEMFDLSLATPEQRRAIASIEVEENARNGNIKLKFKLHPKMDALRMLAQMNGMLRDDGVPIGKALSDAGPVKNADSVQDAYEKYAQKILT